MPHCPAHSKACAVAWPRANILALVAAFIAVSLLGCGRAPDKWKAARPKVVPAQGVVQHQQRPVEGATVLFAPQDNGQAATGRTDAAGRFRLRTFESGDGAVPGVYKVVIHKVEVSDTGEDTSLERDLLPKRYGDAASSDLTATVVEEGTNEFTFDLQD